MPCCLVFNMSNSLNVHTVLVSLVTPLGIKAVMVWMLFLLYEHSLHYTICDIYIWSQNTWTNRFYFLAYNHTLRRQACATDNLAILVLNAQFFFNRIESTATHKINRIRYGLTPKEIVEEDSLKCQIYGWGSRRNVSYI